MHHAPHIAQSNLSKTTRKKEPVSNAYSRLFGLRTFIALGFCMLMTAGTLAFSGTAIQAKGVNHKPTHKPVHKPTHKPTHQSLYQGLILQVDRTNSNDLTFSLLDHRGTPFTFHLTSSTRFAKHQSVSQLNANRLVSVKAIVGTARVLDATFIQLKGHNKAAFAVRGVVASVDLNANSITIALSDGTMLTITVPHAHIATILVGSTLAVNAHFSATGTLIASKYRIITTHSHFQARGIISHINARVRLLTLVSPMGSAFSVIQDQKQSTPLHIGEKLDIRGSSDNKGNLQMFSASVETATSQYLTVIGMVSATNTTASTFSLVDKQGNSSTVNASSNLLASLQIGSVYQMEVSIASDGSMTLTQILSSQGNDQGNTLSLQGTVQFYDASSGLLNVSTDNGENFSLQTNTQTTIVNSDGTAGTLANGEAIQALVQLHTDGTYSVLKIEIQAAASDGNQMTFVGLFLNYDSNSGNLIINPGDHHQLLFATDNNTEVEGASSLDNINTLSIVNVTAQVQPDGSYLATLVQVANSDNQNSNYRTMKR